VIDVLNRYGYNNAKSMAFVQCFEPDETRRIRSELKCNLNLIQLIDGDSWNENGAELDPAKYPGGLVAISEYAAGIGPAISDVVRFAENSNEPQVTSLTTRAHQLQLLVHPYTLRADSLPQGASSFESLFGVLAQQARVDGLFTDFPDRAVKARDGS
jgi:glycerophosphoryl diester phosphodiesterase